MQQRISLEKFLVDGAPSDLAGLIGEIAQIGKTIAREVSRAGLVGLLGAEGGRNIHGEAVQKLDRFAHQLFLDHLTPTGYLAGLASEEMDDFHAIPDPHPRGPFLLLIDPLDGSSNIDVNISVGSIFSIQRKKESSAAVVLSDFLQSGRHQVAAGYLIYGTGTLLILTWGDGVHGFTLDPESACFFLSHQNIRIPDRAIYYSVNEGNSKNWAEKTVGFVTQMKEEGRSARYVGSLVADFHRNLLKGGVFLYPTDLKNRQGKLRLLYEAAPLAFIAEQAGGAATNGQQTILDIQPTALHEKTGLIIGSAADVEQASR
jgi:fructose-1,6-bisphosphatase I